MDVESAIIDGEIIVLNEDGISDFAALRKAITRRQHDDLLHLNGHDLRDMALGDRREILHGMIPPDIRIQFSEALPGEANAIHHLVDKAGLEGMVSKRANSKYRSGPTTNWLKTKSFTESEFELLGVERERGKPAFALMADPGTRKYVGSAFVSVNREMRERLWKRVQEHAGPPPELAGANLRLGRDHGSMHDDLVGLFVCSSCKAAGRDRRQVFFTCIPDYEGQQRARNRDWKPTFERRG
jgi:bifunctional non-homologous end joining protein LigD